MRFNIVNDQAGFQLPAGYNPATKFGSLGRPVNASGKEVKKPDTYKKDKFTIFAKGEKHYTGGERVGRFIGGLAASIFSLGLAPLISKDVRNLFKGRVTQFFATPYTPPAGAAANPAAGGNPGGGNPAVNPAAGAAAAGNINPASRYEGTYFVRFLGIQQKNPTFQELKVAVQKDIEDSNLGRHKGASLYTPKSVQSMPAFDARTPESKSISIEYPFAFLINPEVNLHYWGKGDLDRNTNREMYEQAIANGKAKFRIRDEGGWNGVHNDYAPVVHTTGVDAFINKVNAIGEAVLSGGTYETAGGKAKNDAAFWAKHHNEGVISYHPERDVQGILVRNTKDDIEKARHFRDNYVDASGQKVFKDAFLAYQDASGKIVKIPDPS